MTAAAMKKPSGRLASRKKREQAANILSMVVLILLGLIVMFPITVYQNIIFQSFNYNIN